MDFSDEIEKYFLQITGKKIDYTKVSRDELGKILPVFGWQISVSHSEEYLAVAIFKDGDIGIDIEKRDHAKKLNDRSLKKILAPNEVKIDDDYLNNFVIKEAYSKYLGKGLLMGFSKYDANKLLQKKELKWQKYSTSDYICYLVHDIM